MALSSSIEWTESTWNPLSGCTKVSPGCANCYAERLALRLKAMGNPLGMGEAGFKEAILALIVESTEALCETNWKPWKKTHKEVNRQSLATEMTDILQFWVNAALTMELTPEILEQALRGKWKINKQRIKDGY